jgi:hypothetical protein
MRGKIIFGSIFAVCLLMLLPSIPAVEYKAVTDSYEINDLISKIKINLNDIKGKLKDTNSELLKEKLKKYDVEKINDWEIKDFLSELEKETKDQNSEPKCIIILSLLKIIIRIIKFIVSLGGFIVSSILTIIFLIAFLIFIIIQATLFLIVSFIRMILWSIEGIINSILNFIYDLLSPSQTDVLLIE